jgi:ankyrin repeat protein
VDTPASAILAALYEGRRDSIADGALSRPEELDVFEAAALGIVERLASLLRADPGLATSWTPDGFTPLHLACFFGTTPAAQIVVGVGADVNAVARNEMAVTPLHSAASAQNTPTCEVLIAAGADVNARQRGAVAPLHQAAHGGNQALVEALIQAGADVGAKTDAGLTPANFAAEAGFTELATTLEALAAS